MTNLDKLIISLDKRGLTYKTEGSDLIVNGIKVTVSEQAPKGSKHVFKILDKKGKSLYSVSQAGRMVTYLDKFPINTNSLNQFVLKTEVYKGTWVRGRAKSKTLYLNKPKYDQIGYLSPRVSLVHIMEWLDENEIEVSLQQGDGRTIDFRLHSKVSLQNPTLEQVNFEVDRAIQFALDQELIHRPVSTCSTTKPMLL